MMKPVEYGPLYVFRALNIAENDHCNALPILSSTYSVLIPLPFLNVAVYSETGDCKASNVMQVIADLFETSQALAIRCIVTAAGR